jgi:hypothetical protein
MRVKFNHVYAPRFALRFPHLRRGARAAAADRCAVSPAQGANAIGVVSDQNGVAVAMCTPVCFGGASFAVTARPLTAFATASVTMADVAGPCRGRPVRH